MYGALPKIERSFEFQHTGDVTRTEYKGTFQVKCVLNVSGRHAMELEKTRLMADYANPSTGLAVLAVTLATVRSRIVKAPDWWKETKEGADLIDTDVIDALFEKCVELEKAWRDELKKDGKEADLGNAQTESTQSSP